MNVRIIVVDNREVVLSYEGPIPDGSHLYRINGRNRAIQQISHVIKMTKTLIEGTENFETKTEFVGVEIELC